LRRDKFTGAISCVYTGRSQGFITLVVTAEHLPIAQGRYFATGLANTVMIMAMENAALNAIKPFLGGGRVRWERAWMSSFSAHAGRPQVVAERE